MRRCLALLLLCMVVMHDLPASAQEKPVFLVENAEFQLQDGMLLLDADIAIELPDYIAIAVDQGFAVPVSFEVEILQDRRYWLDRKIVSLKQQFLLHFLPMLNSYVIADVNQGYRAYFDSREEAISSLRQVSRYPMFAISNIGADLKVYARMRFGLDSDELPLPLKSSSLWANDWDLQSEWFEWEIQRPEQ